MWLFVDRDRAGPGMEPERGQTGPQKVDRYLIHDEIAAGGMATVHLGRLIGEGGFSRTVAIKRLHPQYAKDREFVEMLLDEARLAARIRHPNVVATLDVVSSDGELLLVMEYVHGAPLSRLVAASHRRGEHIPCDVAAGILHQSLLGLHAAHDATTEKGEPLKIVHRDVSPQNLMVGMDGMVQVLDFGVAKAAMRATTTQEGKLKGKLAYMAPEQFSGEEVDRRLDVFAAGVVLWETIAGRRLFGGRDTAETIGRILSGSVPPLSAYREDIPPALEAVVLRALSTSPDKRYATALGFARALEDAGPVATAREIREWLLEVAPDALDSREAKLVEVESNHSQVVKTIDDAPVLASSAADLSQVTSRTARRVPPVLFGALAGGSAMAVLAAALLLTLGRGNVPSASSEPARTTGAPTSEETHPTVASAAPSDAPPAAASHSLPIRVDPPEMPSSSKGAAPGPSTKAKSSQPSRSPRTRARPPTSNPVPKAGCSPPYTIDAQGIKRLKPTCF